jgi:hypothetical protein
MNRPGFKIVSGGQTGIDRGALDAALLAGVPCGGSCPRGRRAEDGRIADRYPLVELDSRGYRQRTLRNVLDSDGTLIIYFGTLEGGTELTVWHCIEHSKPYKLIDAQELSVERTVELLHQFVSQSKITVLNVAGPRASQHPSAHDFAVEVLTKFFGIS